MFSITGLIIACLLYHNAHGLSDPQIVGGEIAPAGKAYPYQVSLKSAVEKKHFCDGTIISKRYIITAAYCLDKVNPSTVLVDVGSHLRSSLATIYETETIIKHPNYNKTKHANDIALIKLTKDITFNKNVTSINIISYDQEFDGHNFTIIGWGRLWPADSVLPQHLRQTVEGISQKKCANWYRYITDHHICTFNTKYEGMCNGNSGGALIYNGELVGILTFPCASGFPDVFTKVYHYRSWINSQINAGSNQHLNVLLELLMVYLCTYSFL